MRTDDTDDPQSLESAGVNERQKVFPDMAVVLLATLAAAILCMRFDVSETFFRWMQPLEWLQFDELPAVLLVFAFGFVWFALRRYREASTALARQRAIDRRLSAALVENRRLAQQYLSAQEAERKILARELHDELGQYLNAIKIDAVSIRDCREAFDVREAGGAIAKNADHVYAAVTELIRRLRPVGLDELGLLAAIEHCIEQWRRRLPTMEIVLSTAGDFGDLTEEANLTVYRLIQESLTNAAKHARARHVTVKLSRSDLKVGKSEVRLHIADDGAGIDLSEPKYGFGLISMRERVEMQGGRLKIESSPANGFMLSAQFAV